MTADDRSASGSQAGPSGRVSGHSSQNGHASGRAAGMPHQSGTLPMLASACPGWVCYAEKTHGDLVLPFISAARSPQVLCCSTRNQNRNFWLSCNYPAWLCVIAYGTGHHLDRRGDTYSGADFGSRGDAPAIKAHTLSRVMKHILSRVLHIVCNAAV